MKFTLIIDKESDGEIIARARENTPLIEQIKYLCSLDGKPLVGTKDGNSEILDAFSEVCCFTVEGNKVYANTLDGRYQVKKRLYALEEEYEEFLKINQSCIANVKMIKRFEASYGGSLLVVFKNGHREYVSRRNIKKVKERFGL